MQKSLFPFTTTSLFILLAVFCSPGFAQETDSLKVDFSAICTSVQDREPVGIGENFPVSIGELVCFTRMVGATAPTTIAHVWYFGDTERARVKLGVNLSRWRTYSTKNIQPHEVGPWRVEVLDSDGSVLEEIHFSVTDEETSPSEFSLPKGMSEGNPDHHSDPAGSIP